MIETRGILKVHIQILADEKGIKISATDSEKRDKREKVRTKEKNKKLHFTSTEILCKSNQQS